MPMCTRPRNRARRLLLPAMGVLLFVFLPGAGSAYGQSVSARVNRATIGDNESILFEVVTDGPIDNVTPPDSGDFIVVGNQRSTNIRFANGQAVQQTSWGFFLRPTHTGQLSTGRAAVYSGGTVTHTEAIIITVTPRGGTVAPQQPSVAPQPAPIRPRPLRNGGYEVPVTPSEEPSTGDIPAMPSVTSSQMLPSGVGEHQQGDPLIIAYVSKADPWVGEQVLVDFVYLQPIRSFGQTTTSMTDPEFTGFWFRDVTEQRAAGTIRRSLGTRSFNRESYNAHLLRSYILVPLNEGEQIIPPIEVSIEDRRVFRRANDNARAVRSLPMILDVRDLPAGPSVSSGNVGRFTMRVEPHTVTARAGDTVSLSVVIEGTGIPSRVRPPIPADSDDIRVFDADETAREDPSPRSWITGRMSSRVPVQIKHEGSFEIPPIQFSYFDPWKGQWETLNSEAIEVRAVGVNPLVDVTDRGGEELQSGPAALPQPRPINSSSPPVRRTSVSALWWAACALPWLGLGLWFVGRRATVKREQNSGARAKANSGAKTLRALSAIDPADSDACSSVAACVSEYLKDRHGLATRGRTNSELRGVLRPLVGDAAGELADVLHDCEVARFAGADTSESGVLRDRAVSVVSEIEGAS